MVLITENDMIRQELKICDQISNVLFNARRDNVQTLQKRPYLNSDLEG
jgi:hypothetical protein